MQRAPNQPMRHTEVSDELNEVTGEVLAAAIEVHSILGPGLLETAYQRALARELQLRDRRVAAEVEAPLVYKGERLGTGYRLDLVIDEQVVVELKSVSELTDVHFTQVLTYLKLANAKVGLLINFNEKRLKDGFHRIVR